MKTAIVSGASGFIGSALVDHLCRSGVNVIALGRRPLVDLMPARANLLREAEYVQLAMKDIKSLPEKVDHFWDLTDECVFYNLAWGGRGKLSDMDVAAQLGNIVESVAAFETAEEVGCSQFVQVGSMEEEFAARYLKLDFVDSQMSNRHVIYANAKRLARLALDRLSEASKMEYNYVINSHIMGPHDDKDSFLQVTLQKMISGQELEFSSGRQIFDVVSIHDCVEAYRLVGMFGLDSRTYWVGSGNPKELRDYVVDMRDLAAPTRELYFGKMPFNDVVLEKNLFDTSALVIDTGFSPAWSFAEMVLELKAHLLSQ